MTLIHNTTWTREDVSYNLCRSALLTPNGPFILLPGETYHIDVIADRNGSTTSNGPLANKIYSKISLKRQTYSASNGGKIQEFKFQNLNPYFDGKNCTSNTNCYACTSDSACAWCHGNCFDRRKRNWNQTGDCSGLDLKLRPEQCSNCSSYISCSNCVEIANSKNGGLCEWNILEARCVREGRFPEPEVAVKNQEQCPEDCHQRKNCSQCVDDPGRCVWCESSQVSCFS